MNTKEERIKKFENLIQLKDNLVINEGLKLEPASNFKRSSSTIPYGAKYDMRRIVFLNESVVATMSRLANSAVLVFASAKNPGGGILRGSLAQEEDISLHTTWYFQAKENPDFYLQQGESALNTDNVSVAQGYILTNSYHDPIVPTPIVFLGCAAPNLNGIQSQGLNISEQIIYKHLETRIENILLAAQKAKVEHLILGAFGCGVFGLDYVKVATLFKKIISQGLYRGEIYFSINSFNLYRDFKLVFEQA